MLIFWAVWDVKKFCNKILRVALLSLADNKNHENWALLDRPSNPEDELPSNTKESHTPT